RLGSSDSKLAVVQKFRDGRLCLGAWHAVNRIGVVARDHQQPLDAGKARLDIVVVGFFRQIDNGSFWRVGRLCRVEAGLLARGAAPRVGNIKVAISNAEIGLAILRQRRSPVDRGRARIEVGSLYVET